MCTACNDWAYSISSDGDFFQATIVYIIVM